MSDGNKLGAETRETVAVSRDAVPPKIRDKIEFQEFQSNHRAFRNGYIEYGPDLLYRMENEMGVVYDCGIMLSIMEVLLVKSVANEYDEVIVYYLQALQDRITSEDRSKNIDQLKRVMGLAEAKGLEIKDPTQTTFFGCLTSLVILALMLWGICSLFSSCMSIFK